MDEHVDYANSVNMMLTSVVFVVGLSGVTIQLGNIALTGMVLAALVAMIMSLAFYLFAKFKWLNEASEEPKDML